MGMLHNSGDDTQIARTFQERVRRGEFVEVGKDKYGWPLYMEADTAYGSRLFKGLSAETSRTLHAFARKGGAR